MEILPDKNQCQKIRQIADIQKEKQTVTTSETAASWLAYHNTANADLLTGIWETSLPEVQAALHIYNKAYCTVVAIRTAA